MKNEYALKIMIQKVLERFCHVIAFGFLFKMPGHAPEWCREGIQFRCFLFENLSRVFSRNASLSICSILYARKILMPHCSYLILKIGQMGPRKTPKFKAFGFGTFQIKM